jgi:hypothetical protein
MKTGSVSPVAFRIAVIVAVKAAKDLYSADAFGGKSDPFVEVSLNGASAKTSSKSNENSPVYNETLSLMLLNPLEVGDELKVRVFDKDVLKDDAIGHVYIKLDATNIDGEENWYDLTKGDSEKQGSICVGISATLTQIEPPSTSAEPGVAEGTMNSKASEPQDEEKTLLAAAPTSEETDLAKEVSPPSAEIVESKDTPDAGQEAGPDPVQASKGTVESTSTTPGAAKTAPGNNEEDGSTLNAPASHEGEQGPQQGQADQVGVAPMVSDTGAAAAVGPAATVAGENKGEVPMYAALDASKPEIRLATEVAADDKPPPSVVTVEEIEAYLQHRVVPVLQEGLTQLAEARPSKPLGWLAAFIAHRAADE